MTTKTIPMEKTIFIAEKTAVETLSKKEAKCFDCGCEIVIDGDEIKNGSLLSYDENGKEIFVFKCEKCLSKNSGLEDYKSCEVYSRIVGYLRPVQQWNAGKRQEYYERKEYKIPNA
jgi:Zn finger protein HypA/HybF involved in hydrogenase expression